MNTGDQVIFYTHEQSDYNHTTSDALAFVIAAYDDGSADVVVFPPGGPVRFEKVGEFDPDRAYQAGRSYYRPEGEDPPDFSVLDYSSQPEWTQMRLRHEAQLASARHDDRERILTEQKEERDRVTADLNKKFQRGDGEGADLAPVASEPAPVRPAAPTFNPENGGRRA